MAILTSAIRWTIHKFYQGDVGKKPMSHHFLVLRVRRWARVNQVPRRILESTTFRSTQNNPPNSFLIEPHACLDGEAFCGFVSPSRAYTRARIVQYPRFHEQAYSTCLQSFFCRSFKTTSWTPSISTLLGLSRSGSTPLPSLVFSPPILSMTQRRRSWR